MGELKKGDLVLVENKLGILNDINVEEDNTSYDIFVNRDSHPINFNNIDIEKITNKNDFIILRKSEIAHNPDNNSIREFAGNMFDKILEIVNRPYIDKGDDDTIEYIKDELSKYINNY